MKQFRNLFNEVIDEVKRKLLGVKHKEYSLDEDVFINFKRASELNGVEPYRNAYNYATKHFISIIDLVNKSNLDNKEEIITELKILLSPDITLEKITDAIGYLILIYGMLKNDIRTRYEQEPNND